MRLLSTCCAQPPTAPHGLELEVGIAPFLPPCPPPAIARLVTRLHVRHSILTPPALAAWRLHDPARWPRLRHLAVCNATFPTPNFKERPPPPPLLNDAATDDSEHPLLPGHTKNNDTDGECGQEQLQPIPGLESFCVTDAYTPRPARPLAALLTLAAGVTLTRLHLSLAGPKADGAAEQVLRRLPR